MEKFITEFYGKSMQPTLKEGMQILVEKIKPEDVKVADILLYRKGNSLVAHRVIKMFQEGHGKTFVTKADNHAYMDAALIPEGDAIGLVRAVFCKNDPQKNVLVKNKLIDSLYVTLGNTAFFFRKNRKSVPTCIRMTFRYFVDGFFLCFKKLIHFLYQKSVNEAQ